MSDGPTTTETLEREYKAWIVCGVFKADKKRGRPQRGPFPMYARIGGMLPFFTTKRQAREWLIKSGYTVPGPLGLHVVRVTVRAQPSPDTPRAASRPRR